VSPVTALKRVARLCPEKENPNWAQQLSKWEHGVQSTTVIQEIKERREPHGEKEPQGYAERLALIFSDKMTSAYVWGSSKEQEKATGGGEELAEEWVQCILHGKLP
jgi:hypothetical protein